MANSKERSFPFGLADDEDLLNSGELLGVLCMLVFGVELNSEQMIEPESLQPVLSSTGAVKISK